VRNTGSPPTYNHVDNWAGVLQKTAFLCTQTRLPQCSRRNRVLFCVERLTSFQCSRKSGRQTEREGGKEVGIEMQKAHRSAPSPVLILACVMGVGILWQTADNDGQGIIHKARTQGQISVAIYEGLP
jgi:hypothetical protein